MDDQEPPWFLQIIREMRFVSAICGSPGDSARPVENSWLVFFRLWRKTSDLPEEGNPVGECTVLAYQEFQHSLSHDIYRLRNITCVFYRLKFFALMRSGWILAKGSVGSRASQGLDPPDLVLQPVAAQLTEPAWTELGAAFLICGPHSDLYDSPTRTALGFSLHNPKGSGFSSAKRLNALELMNPKICASLGVSSCARAVQTVSRTARFLLLLTQHFSSVLEHCFPNEGPTACP